MTQNHENNFQYVFYNILWDSPENGILFITIIGWHSQQDRLKLSGYRFDTVPPSDIQLDVFPNTPNWTSLNSHFLVHQQIYRINYYIYGKFLEYLALKNF